MQAQGRREEGQQIILVSLMLPVLLLLVGLVIDVGNLYFHRRMVQNAVDAAAMAGSARLSLGTSSAEKTALAYAASNGYDNNGTTNRVTFLKTDQDCFVVQIDENVQPLLVSLVWNGSFTVSAQAGACAMKVAIGSSVIVLDPSAGPALSLSGSSRLNVTNGNVHVNSNSPSALTVGGSARITTQSPTTVVGGWSGNIQPSPVKGGVQPDPLLHLPVPAYDCNKATTLSTGSASPGCYTKISMGGKNELSLSPGVYVLGSGLKSSDDAISTSGNAELTGSGVMFYILKGNVSIGGKQFAVTPPTSGEYEGVTFFSARSEPTVYDFGSNVEGVEGIIYAANGSIDLTGGPALNVNFAVRRLSLGGNAALTVTGFKSDTNWTTLEYRLVE